MPLVYYDFLCFFSEGAFWGTGVHFAINIVYLVGNLILEKPSFQLHF